MARRLRIQYPGALYHVVNRGNYRRDLFSVRGSAQAFSRALEEACERHGWRVHAYVVMRNHYHLALETPTPNLVDGMHWLQSTFGTRFNRFRAERGHLFQGRYQAILIEDDAALACVAHYIHLNPVRAGAVALDQLASYRPSSLGLLSTRPRVRWLVADRVLAQLALADTPAGLARYVQYLTELAADRREQERLGFGGMCRGWAIGTEGWKRALARRHAQLALEPGWRAEEIQDFKEERWRAALEAALRGKRRNPSEGVKYPGWKYEVARQLRQVGAPYTWIARALHTGNPATLRNALWRLKQLQHATA